MVTSVYNEEELAKAIKNNTDTIEIHGNLAKRTIRIKAAGNVAWAVAFGAIAVAMASVFLTMGTGGTAAPVATTALAGAAPAATAVLGLGTTITVGSLVIAAGSISAAKLLFGKLRKEYVIEGKTDNFVLLKKK